MSRLRNALAFAAALFVSFPLLAAKTIDWDALDVRAHLDASGKLHVTERHAMRFNGDWNGGERTFRVEEGQQFVMEGMARIDGNGVANEMTQGDLSLVDHWDLNGKQLRWRSRLPSDPEFRDTKLVYEIRYTLDQILLPGGGDRYTLNHDFAFPNRPSPIDRFTLTFDVAQEWSAPDRMPFRAERTGLAAGDGYVLRMPLRYRGAAAPVALPFSKYLARVVRPWLIAIPPALLLLWFFLSERRRNRAVAPDTAPIDEAWLEKNVFVHSPELAGMLLDGDVGAREVAAIFATMERDGKLRSTLVPKGRGKPDLEMKLLVPLETLEGREKILAQRLFLATGKVTASSIRKSHQKSGLDLPAMIRDSIVSEAEVIAPGVTEKVRSRLAGVFFVAALAAFIAALTKRPSEMVIVFLVIIGGLVLLSIASWAGDSWRRSPGLSSGVRLIVPAAFFWLAAEGCQRVATKATEGTGQFSFYATLAIACVLGGFYTLILDFTRREVSAEGMRWRMLLSRARAWFALELQKESPAIRDEWMPWLIAFGLDEELTGWWKAFGAKDATVSAASSSSTFATSSSRSPSGGSATPIFSGGGGKFGGAGASGSWGTAATAFAAPITGARSLSGGGSGSSSGSSSSSSSSSGSSSGGGGGGGW